MCSATVCLIEKLHAWDLRVPDNNKLRSLPGHLHASVSLCPFALLSFTLILKGWLGTMSILGSGSSHMQGSRGVSLVFQTTTYLVVVCGLVCF